MIDWDKAQAYDNKHAVSGILYDAFEDGGGCGHDLGLTGVLSIIREWENIRTAEMVEDLLKL
jgi:hypothetical protein